MKTTGLILLALLGVAKGVDITVESTGGNYTSGLQYGIMFEDISRSGDGGIYAELIRNRAFQGSTTYASAITPWTAVGDAELSLKELSVPLSEALPTSLHVAASSTSSNGTIGISNPGYWGIEVQEQEYTGSFYVKGAYTGEFTALLKNTISGETLGSVQIESKSEADAWVQHSFTLTPSAASNENNTFQITFDSSEADDSALDFNLISLFPPTYNGRSNGMRKDLMELLADLNPSFFRLPGGNNLEGDSSPYMWKWNETIGNLTERPGRPGTWGYENTDGLGLVEYMEWCDDLDIEPVLAVWAGLYLDDTVISKAALEYYVNDTMDELEFLMGDTSTTYGALRASVGHPEPWTINYIEVGNEDNLNSGLSSYKSYRFSMFKDAINDKYPDILVFASTVDMTLPTGAGGDYHQYTRPDYFVGQFDFFDDYSASHPTMIGEYSSAQPNIKSGGGVNWSSAKSAWPFWIGTVAEAVFLIGAERNADKIFGAAYAPLLQNLNSYQWTPDLISFSAMAADDIKSTSYELVKYLSQTRITEVLPATEDFDPLYYVAGLNNVTNEYIFKGVVYNTTAAVPVTIDFPDLAKGDTASLTLLTADDPYAVNDEADKDVVIKNVTTLTAGTSGVLSFTMPEWSVAILTASY